MNGEWIPLLHTEYENPEARPNDYHIRLWCDDAELGMEAIHDIHSTLIVQLPDNIRLCEFVPTPATPAAWGPPQAQPDAEGWWAFQGQTPDELGVRLLAEVYPADPDGGDLELFAETDRAGGGYYAYEMTGTWRKLLVDPWEAES
jgi:hypothetical protein